MLRNFLLLILKQHQINIYISHKSDICLHPLLQQSHISNAFYRRVCSVEGDKNCRLEVQAKLHEFTHKYMYISIYIRICIHPEKHNILMKSHLANAIQLNSIDFIFMSISIFLFRFLHFSFLIFFRFSSNCENHNLLYFGINIEVDGITKCNHSIF